MASDSTFSPSWGERLRLARERRLLSREALSALAVTVSTGTIYRLETMGEQQGRPRSLIAILAGLHAALPLDESEIAALAPGVDELQLRRALARQQIMAQSAPVTKTNPEKGPGSVAFLSERLATACGRPMATQILHALIAVFEGVPLTLPESSPLASRPATAAIGASPPPGPPPNLPPGPLPPPPPGAVKIRGEDGVTIYQPARPPKPKPNPQPQPNPQAPAKRHRRAGGSS